MKRRLIGFLCVLALLCAILPAALGADTMYFMAVNDKLLDYSPDTMPIVSRGTVYVPYTVFLQSSNGGVDLGVFGGPNKPLNIVSLYGQQKMVLTFDIGAGTAYDMMDNTYPGPIVRNGVVFVPAWVVCQYFDLQYSYLPNSYGALIRIKRPDGYYLEDPFFVTTAQERFRTQKAEFDRTQDKSKDPGPTASAAPSPSPTPGGDKSKVQVSFAFRISGETGPEKLAQTLERYDQRGLFFFPAGELGEWDDQIRRLVATGHKVGFWVDGADADTCRAQADQANALLAHIARTRSDFLLAPDGVAGQLTQEGWVCWQGHITADASQGTRPANLAVALRTQIETRRSVARLTLDDSALCAGALERLLPRLHADGYSLVSVTEVMG